MSVDTLTPSMQNYLKVIWGLQEWNDAPVSNSAIGVILLATGALSSLLAVWGTQWALVFLAVLGVLGVVGAARLPEVSAG